MRCVFSGTGGFLGRIDSATRLAFWADEPTGHDFDPSLLVTIDLARTPSAAAAGAIAWDAVEVDDCYLSPTGGIAGTTLGPRWPEVQVVGAVFLEHGFVARLPAALRPACPPRLLGGRAYEHHTALYWPHVDDARAGNHYTGHHADILEERGGLARVAVYPPGMSDSPDARTQVMWLDLASPEQCDAGPGALTRIGAGDAPKSGPLFLISGRRALDAS